MANSIVIFGASGDLTSRKLIPALYSFYDVDQWPGQAEFTVSETITPAVVIFGALAPKNPRPYTGPLPDPR